MKAFHTAVAVGTLMFSSQICAETVERGAKHSITVFAGRATRTNFIESMYAPWSNDLKNVNVLGAAYSRRFGTWNEVFAVNGPAQFGDHLFIEGEFGGSYRFGHEDLGEVWTGVYLRYDDFPWNDSIYTTVAVNTGLSLLTEKSAFERSRNSSGKTWELLHYMGPEITFADPDNRNLEFLIRYHHRSGVFGLFNGVVSGSTFISTGIRYRF